jgi:hypothetical protein
MTLNRNFAETHGALASIAAMRGNLAAAERMADVARRLDANSMAAQFALSLIAAKAGNTTQSEAIVADALKVLAGTDPQSFARLLHIASGSQPWVKSQAN